jgi:hexosaminidase
VDVVPCLELYGHLHDLFRVERYADMAAIPHGSEFNPLDPRVAPLLKNWIAQFADLFPSKFVHIGFDEPWELERGGKTAGADPSKLFLGALQSVSSMVSGHGKRVLFWADIHSGADVLTRYPQLLSQLPAGIIPVPWVYHVLKDYTAYVEPLAKAHVPQMVASGVWCWNEVVPDYNRTFANIDGLLADGRKYGAIGLINTGWTDDAQVLYRMALPGMAYGAVAAWQTRPVERAAFLSDYARQFYSAPVAAEIGPALDALNQSRQHIENALGGETMHRFWDDPLEPRRLERSAAHREDLRQARLKAEEAEERLERALAMNGDPATLRTLLLGARMLDYLGMKNIYAVEIAGFFQELGPTPKASDMWPILGAEISTQNHGRIDDLMDTISELREAYREAWKVEYTPYRLGAALGRWDAEYEYWRRLQRNIGDVEGRFKQGDRMPALESLRPRM